MADPFGQLFGSIATLAGSNAASSGDMGRKAARAGVHAYTGALPNQLMFNQAYDPQFAALGSQNLADLLFGADARTINVPKYNSAGKPIGTRAYDVGAQRGLLDIMGEAAPRFGELSRAARAQGVESNLGLLDANLGQAQDFYNASNPELKALRDSLTQTASQQLKAGSKLYPEDAYRITSGVRGDWASRGLGASAPAQLDEAVQLAVGGENLRQSRTQSAGDIMSRLAASEPDYARFILGLGDDTALANAFNLTSANQGSAYNQDYDLLGVGAPLGSQSAQYQYLRQQDRQQAYSDLGSGIWGLGGAVAGASGGGSFFG